jgi:hypothetical protein
MQQLHEQCAGIDIAKRLRGGPIDNGTLYESARSPKLSVFFLADINLLGGAEGGRVTANY